MSPSTIFALALAASVAVVNPVAGKGADSSNASLGADRLPRKDSADFAIAAERAGLEPSYRRRPLGLDYMARSPSPHFYYWSVIPTWGEGVAFYYVDKRTGTVWGGYTLCQPIHSRELAALQARFRRRYHVLASTVRQIEREGSPLEECRP